MHTVKAAAPNRPRLEGLACINSKKWDKARTDLVRIGIGPFVRKRCALIGLYRVYRAEIIFGKINARTVGTAFQDKPLTIRSDLCLGSDEIAFGKAEIFRNAGYLGVIDPDDSVLYAAARAALPALERHT